MIYNFESWRKAKMERHANRASLMHYHRISDDVYRSVRNFIEHCLCRRVDKGKDRISVLLPEDIANTLMDFLDETKFAYIHPRSTSGRVEFFREARQTICITHHV